MPHRTNLLVSLDGVAPRGVTSDTMPHLTGLASTGAACWSARTVTPSITLPAHISMLRSVSPSVHRVLDNTPVAPCGDAPSLLRHARQCGLRTGSVHAWTPIDIALESDATDLRMMFDSGYDPADDDRSTTAAIDLITSEQLDLLFVYLVAPDLAGHEHGWLSAAYLEALTFVDHQLGRLIRAVGPDAGVAVTTDHGGLANDHHHGRPQDLETFVVARSPRIAAGSLWDAASVLDVAPTVAAMCDLPAAALWEGRSLVGAERPVVDVMLALLASMANERYGETVTMLDHSLQTAALAVASEAHDEMVAAALLHDLGHLLGEAGTWGLPSHAEVGARWLQQFFPAGVHEPIRLHVDAKRCLVATDPDYAGRLSEASTQSLIQQGGPFTADEVERFLSHEHARVAMQLRRWDDAGKVDDLEVRRLDHYRPLLTRLLVPMRNGVWARDSCRCAHCRDPRSDQHLIDVADLDGWQTVRDDGDVVLVAHADGRVHRCELPDIPAIDPPAPRWDADHTVRLAEPSIDHVALAVARSGIALTSMDGLGYPNERGAVLEVAGALGFVRATNYGELFDVLTLADANNLAYSALGLPLHTDNPYRDPCPTVQLLHCLSPADQGGGSLFSDGFRAADVLRDRHPDAFQLLSSMPVRFRFHDANVDLEARRALIEIDGAGNVMAVSVNHRSMEAPEPGPDATAFYRAYRLFRDLLASPDAVARLDLAAGDLVVFDNRRVLHGRDAFSSASDRHLQGCYIDIDAIRSRARQARAHPCTF